MENDNKNNFLVLINSNSLVKAKNSIEITNKLLDNNQLNLKDKVINEFSLTIANRMTIIIDDNYLLTIDLDYGYYRIEDLEELENNDNCEFGNSGLKFKIVLFDYKNGGIIREISFESEDNEFAYLKGNSSNSFTTLNYDSINNIIILTRTIYGAEYNSDIGDVMLVPSKSNVYSIDFLSFGIINSKIIDFPIESAALDINRNHIWFQSNKKTVVCQFNNFDIFKIYNYEITSRVNDWEDYYEKIKDWGKFIVFEPYLNALICINNRDNFPKYTIKTFFSELDSIIKTTEFCLTEYERIDHCDYSENKKQLAFIDNEGKNAKIYDLNKNEIIKTIEFANMQFYEENQEHYNDISYSVTGKHLLIYYEGQVYIYETNNYELLNSIIVLKLDPNEDEIRSGYFELEVKFSNDCKHIITIKVISYLKVWNI